MELSQTNLKTLLISLHEIIESGANYYAERLFDGEGTDILQYPPNNGFTVDESNSLTKLNNDTNLKSALRKILANCSAGALFEVLSMIDGVSDPNPRNGNWSELCFVDKTDELAEDAIMLHDEFYATYWDWMEIRPESDWKLDTYNGQ